MGDDFEDSGIEDNCYHSLHGDEFKDMPGIANFGNGMKVETAGDYLPETRSGPAAWLLEQLDDIRLDALRWHFFPNCPSDIRISHHKRRLSYKGVGLTKEQFATAVCGIIGTNVIWEQAVGLHDRYARLTSGLGETDAYVTPTEKQSQECPRLLYWEQIIDALLEEPSESDWTPLETPQTFRAKHLKREPIVKVIPLQTTKSFCYVVVSRWGRVGIYDASFKLLDVYRVKLGFTPLAKMTTHQRGMKEDTGEVERSADRRRGLPWINDVVYLPDALSIIFLCSDCSLHVWSAEWLLHSRKWIVMSIPCVVLSAAYKPSDCKSINGVSTAETQSHLFLGDEEGFVTTITFFQPRSSLFRPKDTENKKDEFFWAELRFQTNWVRINTERIHSCAVNDLRYFPDGKIGLSTSYDPAASLVLFWPTERKPKTVLKLSQGATCVTMSKSHRTIVAGCRDGTIQIWPLPPSIPPVVLRQKNGGQIGEAAIRDLHFVNNLLLSVDDKGVLRLWNLQTEECIQAVNLPVDTLKSKAISSLPHTPNRLFCGPRPVPVSLFEGQTYASTDSAEIHSQKESTENSNRATGTVSETSSENLTNGDKSSDNTEHYPMDVGVSCGTGVILVPFCPPPKPPPLLPLPTETPRRVTFDERQGNWTSRRGARHFPQPPDSLPQPQYPSSLCGTLENPSNDTASPEYHEDEITEVLHLAEVIPLKALEVNPQENRDLQQLFDAAKAFSKGFTTNKLIVPNDKTLVCKSSEMKRLVKENAPYLALRLAPEVPLKFSQKLPMSSRMRARKLDLSEPKRLIAAKLPTTLPSQEETSALPPLRALAHAAGSYMVGVSDFFKPRESTDEAFDKLYRGSKYFPGTEQK